MVKSGIEAGESVVIDGQTQLRPGAVRARQRRGARRPGGEGRRGGDRGGGGSGHGASAGASAPTRAAP